MNDERIETLKRFRNRINSSEDYFDKAVSKLKKSGENLSEGVILNNKAYDKGRLNECALLLANISSDLKSIAQVCSTKINELTVASTSIATSSSGSSVSSKSNVPSASKSITNLSTSTDTVSNTNSNNKNNASSSGSSNIPIRGNGVRKNIMITKY